MNKRVLLRELKNIVSPRERAETVLQKKYYSNDVAVARQLQNRIELHVTGSTKSAGFNHFETFYKTLLPKDKHFKFGTLINGQMPTVENCDNIFKELKKVFTAQNAEIYFAFDDASDKTKAESIINDDYFIQETVWERMQYAPNDILLIKRDEEGNPSHEFIDINSVVDVCSNDDGTINYVLYQTRVGKRDYTDISGLKKSESFIEYVYIDHEYVVVLEEIVRGKSRQVTEISSTPHGLDWCPAIFTFPKVAYPKLNNATVKSPLLKMLSYLDWLAFFKISKRYFDSYGAYPIISKFEEKGSYDGDESDEVLANGFFNEIDLEQDTAASLRPKATTPARNIDNLVGAGAVIEVPIPQPQVLENMLESVKIITVPKENLDWIDEQEVKLAERLFKAVCGEGAEFTGKFSASPDQIEVGFDSRKSVLADLRVVFERLHKFYVDTIFSMEFPESYDPENTNIFYGDTYYLMSEGQVVDTYNKFVESGMPESVKLNQLRTLLYTQYNGSPNELFRAMVLLNAEPFPTTPKAEITTMLSNGMVPEYIAFKKYYFNDVIEQFELEEGEISTMKNSGIKNAVKVLDEYFKSKYGIYKTESILNLTTRENRDENTSETTTRRSSEQV
jgi:hypothetical protein